MHHRDGSRPVIALPVPALVERLTRLAAGTGTIARPRGAHPESQAVST
jgi:hypothetical protein